MRVWEEYWQLCLINMSNKIAMALVRKTGAPGQALSVALHCLVPDWAYNKWPLNHVKR